jgi:hypothetical protein
MTGTVRLDCCIVLAAGSPLARITSGASASNRAAADRIQSLSLSVLSEETGDPTGAVAP